MGLCSSTNPRERSEPLNGKVLPPNAHRTVDKMRRTQQLHKKEDEMDTERDGLILLAFRTKSSEADPTLPVRVILGAVRGVDSEYEAQILARTFAGDDLPDPPITANDYERMKALGFTPEKLGISPHLTADPGPWTRGWQ